MNRRQALQLLGAGSVAGITACASQRAVTPSSRTVLSLAELGPSPTPWPVPDPFLFCVHHDDAYPTGNAVQGPNASLDGRHMGMDFESSEGWRMYHGRAVPGFPMHPHRGFETVTVVRQGLLDHSDSLGATARYGRGDVQWLTAGGGIQHAEMFPLVEQDAPNPTELFQIWLNLPRANKFAAPHFAMLWNDAIPRHDVRDASGRAVHVVTMAGALDTKAVPSPPPDSWAHDPANSVAIWTIKLAANATWTIPPAPAGTNRWLYFFTPGELTVDGTPVPSSHAAELRAEASAVLRAGNAEIELLMLQGKPIGEPVVQRGPFVMNTKAEIQTAIRDYQETQFGGWKWSSTEPVHPRDAGRFAQHADGTVDRPELT
ncbi:MAG TPA: pirin family protein [Kofleriaceae bacterium]